MMFSCSNCFTQVLGRRPARVCSWGQLSRSRRSSITGLLRSIHQRNQWCRSMSLTVYNGFCNCRGSIRWNVWRFHPRFSATSFSSSISYSHWPNHRRNIRERNCCLQVWWKWMDRKGYHCGPLWYLWWYVDRDIWNHPDSGQVWKQFALADQQS